MQLLGFNRKFAVCFFSLATILPMSSYAQQDDDLIYSIYEMIANNNLSIHSYDVLIREQYLKSAASRDDEDIFTSTDVSVISRIVMDRTNEKCLRVYRVYGESEGKKTWRHYQTVNKNNPHWWLDYYEEGKCIKRGLSLDRRVMRPWKSDFYGFCRSSGIPFVEMSTWFEFDYPFGKSLEDSSELSAWTSRNTAMRVIGDGTISLTHQPPIASGIISSKTLDSRSKMPVSHSVLDNRKGENRLIRQYKTKLELVNGIYRVTSISLEIQDVGPDYASLTKKYASDTKKSQQGMLLTTIGTVDIEWLQFNNDSLKFPTTEDLGSERRTWAKFLKLSTDELAKDNAVNKPSDLR